MRRVLTTALGVFTLVVISGQDAMYLPSVNGGAAQNGWGPEAPADYDMEARKLHIALYPNMSSAPFDMVTTYLNLGGVTVNSVDVSYSINGGTAFTAQLTGMNVPGGDSTFLVHPALWSPGAAGTYVIDFWITAVNGNADEDPSNDTTSATVVVSDSVVNLIDNYIGGGIKTMISSSSQLDYPRDLDFHPDFSRKELWVVNRKTEAVGGSTTIYSNAGEGNQTSEVKKDQNSWHFMSLPSGIAFSENGNFATSTSVFDANHDGGQPFTGPTLWSSDPAIYAQPSGGNGSHLDMLHESPHCMGIANQDSNVFWVTDTYNHDIVRYDFVEDHGPGNDYHGDGKIRRYPVLVQRINDDIPCHLAFDNHKKWLYAVNGLAKRVVRLDVTSGSLGGIPSFGPYEVLAEYRNMTGITWENVVTTGLDQPSGIAVLDNRMLVSDHANGDIVIYDITSMPATELGRVTTWDPGIMGLTIGPEGHIWYVNGPLNAVFKVVPGVSSVHEPPGLNINVFPNPTSDHVTLRYNRLASGVLSLVESSGKVVLQETVSGHTSNLDTSHLPAGLYLVRLEDQNGVHQISTLSIQR